jgi:integrase
VHRGEPTLAWLIQRRDRRSRWYVCFRTADGREVRRAAGKSRRSAERIRAKLETQLREDRFLERQQKSTWTLSQLSDTYLARMTRLRPRSARWRAEMFRQVLRSLGPDLRIEEIRPETLDGYVSRRLGEGKAAGTVNREVAVLRHAVRQAARWKKETHLAEYRLADWTPLREEDDAREPVFLTREEVSRLLAAASNQAAVRGMNGYQAEVVIRLALETGARLGEILHLTWADFGREGVLRIRTEKHGPDRSIQLDRSTVELLERLRRADDRWGAIFPSSRTGRARCDVRRFWSAVRRNANLEQIRFHDLRHTAASEMLRQGFLLREVQYVLGHASPRMTERYAHFARTFQPPKALSWVQQTVMQDDRVNSEPGA